MHSHMTIIFKEAVVGVQVSFTPPTPATPYPCVARQII